MSIRLAQALNATRPAHLSYRAAVLNSEGLQRVSELDVEQHPILGKGQVQTQLLRHKPQFIRHFGLEVGVKVDARQAGRLQVFSCGRQQLLTHQTRRQFTCACCD